MREENPNVAMLREGYQKWHQARGGSFDFWGDAMAEDVDFRSLGSGAAELAFASPRSSRDQVRAQPESLTSQFEMIH